MFIAIIGLSCGFGSYAAYQLFNSALSDTLGLHTLRHGTGPLNYLSIQVRGARPDLGGIASGEATLMDYSATNHTKNKFFVWNDEYYKEGNISHDSEFLCWLLNCKPLHPIIKRLGPKYYTIQGGISAATINNAPQPIKICLQILGGIVGLLTPVIDFHTTPENFESNFVVDDKMEPVARHTSKYLNSWKYIGLTGVLYQGINTKILKRINADPTKFVKGLAKMLLLTVLILSIISALSMYAHVPGLINIYSFIAHAASNKAILSPLSLGFGMGLPFASLAAS